MFRAPTEKRPSQISATFGDTIPKTSETVVLVGKSPKKKLDNQELQKRNSSSLIGMCTNRVRYATSYQIHSTLLMISSYHIHSLGKKGINIIAPSSFFGPKQKRPLKTQISRGFCVDRPTRTGHHRHLRKTDLLKFKRTKVPAPGVGLVNVSNGPLMWKNFGVRICAEVWKTHEEYKD